MSLIDDVRLLIANGTSISEIKKRGYSASILKNLGYLAYTLAAAGYSFSELTNVGYKLSDLTYSLNSSSVNQVNGQTFVTEAEKAAWNSNSLGISFTATETVAAFVAVTSTGKSGNSADITQRNKIIGINKALITSGFVGYAIGVSTIVNPLWSWTIGDKIYLNGTSLSITSPSTGFLQSIGTATASNTIDVKLGVSILL